jgi:hypothetical protein
MNRLENPDIQLENKRRIYFLYDANGVKLRRCYYEDNHLMETTGEFITAGSPGHREHSATQRPGGKNKIAEPLLLLLIFS